ncbi:glycoside hydrolase family 88 protein [Paenibacillus wynnii]|uniref:Glucuronyl hydrolase n=1 Tax=Paenibacillus wynnii TaxID=268407 RepID=A0A098M9P5_9BACL|nr:glycoside hydrolase family 88 protein [Paenibacillus wynnii]KGE18776.1 hypothetical protein PWYN_04885 [Paenibacillus wynnii]
MYQLAERISAPEIGLPDGMRIPFGWSASPVVPGEGKITALHWDESIVLVKDHVRFRIAVAVDVRENKIVEVFALKSGRVLGTLDIRFAHVFQIFELPMSLNDAITALKEGIGLRLLQGNSPLWFFVQGTDGSLDEPTLLPHLMDGSGGLAVDAFGERFNTLASIQQFGWMEGCVLDGLMDMGQIATIHKHLDLYITAKGDLTYEDPKSYVVDGRFYGIESTLPIAILAKLEPSHILVEQAVQFMFAHTDEMGIIKDGDMLSSEGSYTIAYPLAVIASQRGDHRLAQMAYKQLQLRRDLLWHEEILFLRRMDDESRTFGNWGRAYGWHLLGLIRSLEEFKRNGLLSYEQELIIEEEFARTLRRAFSYRNEQGLWNCFLDEPETGIDTSASAAIAAAAAIAIRTGLPDYTGGADLDLSVKSLLLYLTPDGLMTGTAQSNKNGESLQRSGYRVLSQMTMGLMGQLLATTKNR